MGIDLFNDSDSGADGAVGSPKIEINKDFAKRFEYNKKREALSKCNELKKRGLLADSDDSEESSDESSGDEALKDDFQFYDALVRVKKNDPAILQREAKLFSSSSEDDGEEKEEKKMPKTKEKVKPLYLKDVMARHLMEDGPEFDEEPLQKNRNVYNREQAEGLKAFLEAEKEAFGPGDDDDNDDDDDDVIIEQKKGSRKEVEEGENVEKIKMKVGEFFGEDSDLSEGEMFLKNYCLNQMWVDKEKDAGTYDDIEVSEDEDELERQDQYEAEYNFRHEEGNEDRVLGHSRITMGSVRKKNSSRKEQRKSKDERIAQADFERKEELKHLKNLKKKEIQEKLERIRVTAGIGEESCCNLDAACLEQDFDPEEYDKAMKDMFGVDYYKSEDVDPDFGSDAGDDLEKPDFDKEDELLGLTKGWDSGDTRDGFEGMRKARLNKVDEELSHVESKMKRKRKISPSEKVELDKELEEYYKLDYEGTIGDLKTRFKYRTVPANSYGLETEEILIADDKDLGQYVSLKKLAPYRDKEWNVTYHQKLKKNMILQGMKSDSKVSDNIHISGQTRNAVNIYKKSEEAIEDSNSPSKRSRKRHKHAQLKLSKSRLIAYGKIPSKRHKKH